MLNLFSSGWFLGFQSKYIPSQMYRLGKAAEFLLQALLCSSLSTQLVPQAQATLLLTVHER